MTARALCLAGVGALSFAPLEASAQAVASTPYSLSLAQSRQSWHDLEFAFGAVALVGLLDDDSALTVIGTVGLLFCLVQSDQGRGFHFSPQGFEFSDAHGFSAGITPFGMTDLQQGPRPAAFLQLSFKF